MPPGRFIISAVWIRIVINILITQIGTPTFALDGPTAMPAALRIFAHGAAKQTKHACDPKTVYLRGPFTSPQEAQNDYDVDLKMMRERHPASAGEDFRDSHGCGCGAAARA